MKGLVATICTSGVIAILASSGPRLDGGSVGLADGYSSGPSDPSEIIGQYCVRCHSDRRMSGNLTLESYDAAEAAGHAETSERIIRKLRAGMMPPPGAARPPADSLDLLVESIEGAVDEAWARDPNPGSRSFQRLNRAEYAAAIRDLLSLEIDPREHLPLDSKSANFDNIADAQFLSPTLIDAYVRAADNVARLAMGVPDAPANSVTYTNSGYASQWERVPGAPRGTRGGISVVHNFPADGDYDFTFWFEHTTTGEFFGNVTPGEQLELSIDGVPVVTLEVDRWMHTSDPNGASQKAEPVFVTSGPHRVTAAFIMVQDGPLEDLLSPHDWSLVDRKIGTGGYGVTAWAHLKDVVIAGPHDPTGVSSTPSREAILVCTPSSPAEERPCAEEIIAGLAEKAFRRPVTDELMDPYLGLYDQGAATSGFEVGVRTALQGILASPDFIFRVERAPPAGASAGDTYRVSDYDLASRLSFFLWGGLPDDELLQLAADEDLSEPSTLREQVDRMLADERADALSSRFAAQWLRLEDLEKVNPDRLMYPDYHKQLADAMLVETEMFFNSIVAEDRSVLELFTADYTFVNERLAKHYGFPDVAGEDFRRVEYPDDSRSGLLGHGSILTLTSHAGRTSPVLRGKWVMEVLMGTPPPPPPPNVPSLDESTDEAAEGRVLTTRERLAAHRQNPTCNSCHRFIDPIGLALENFDPTGRYRIRENGSFVQTETEFYDGTPMASSADLRDALLARPVPLVRNFTENLMAYALGRRVEYYDMPALRNIVARAEAEDYAFSAFVHGIVESDAFQARRLTIATDQLDGIQR